MFQSVWSSIFAIHLISLTGLMGCGFEAPLDSQKNTNSDKRDPTELSRSNTSPGTDSDHNADNDADYPLFTGDSLDICSHIQFRNSAGEIKTGQRTCQSSEIESPDLIPENIKDGITIAGVTGSLKRNVADCQTDGEIACVTSATNPAVASLDLAGKIAAGEVLGGIAGIYVGGAYSACSEDGATACVTIADFPAVANNLLNAGNFRAGVEIGGITGAYPSVAHRLTQATGLPDLSSLGPATPIGSYEFFDSAGNRYETTIADPEIVVATANLQIFSTANTVFRAISVAGDPNLLTSNIRDGVGIFGVEGEATPIPSPCTVSGGIDCLAVENFPAVDKSQLHEGNIRTGVQILDVTGAYPSSAYPLAEATATADLVSLGSTTDLGDYEFFDSAGQRLTVSILEGSDIVASDEEQSFGTAGSVYRAFSVAGDANLLSTNIRDGITIFGVEGDLIPMPANCQVDGETGCVADGDFPAVSTTLLTAGNIKAGEVIGGVTGDYPSADHRLATAEATDDLPALGPSMAAGTYQFFDSAGNRYQTEIADGGTITPSTDTQSFSEVGTVYRGFSVAGDANLVASNIRDSLSIFATPGELVPVPTECNADDSIGCLAVEDYPAIDKSQLLAEHIRTGVDILDITGAYPSSDYPLAEATATPDLVSLGSTTDLGDYEFFDSTGQRLTVTILEASNIFASDEEQSFGTAGSVYRTFSVAGDANLLGTNIRDGVTLFGVEGELIPRPANCLADGATGCVTDEDFPAVDKTFLTAGNIKAGEVLGGVTGDYPSADHRLASAEATDDLPALGPFMTVGTYQFFDSAGNRYQTAIADGGTITPTTSTQSFSEAGTVFRGFSVAGDAGLVASNIRDSLSIFAISGELTPIPSSCDEDESLGCLAVAEFPAVDKSLVLAENIRSGVNILDITGAYPSSNHPLATATDTQDLVSLDLTTDLGDYEFFDSTGHRLTVSVLEATNIIAGDQEQSFGESGVIYRSFSVAGEANLLASNIRDGVTLFEVEGELIPRPADCQTDGSTGCVTDEDFPGVSTSLLTAGNIRAGVIIGGITGDFPSADNRLPSATATPDLVSVGPATPVGSYEFFDSAGMRYEVTILDGGTITPSTASQSFSTASSVYKAFSVAGDAALQASNIRNDIQIFNTTGQVHQSPDACDQNESIGCVSVEDFPAVDRSLLVEGSIRTGVEILDIEGAYPSVSYRLAGSTATPDLPSLGPATELGIYEFFDSAGNRYTVEIADEDTITASSIDQVFSAAGTVHRSIRVAGDSDLIASNIRDGVTMFGVAGLLIEHPGLCTISGTQSCVVEESFYAASVCSVNGSNCFIPDYEPSEQALKAINYDAIDPDKMLTSQTIDGKTGTIVERGTWNLSTSYPGDGYFTGVSNVPSANLIVNTATILGVEGEVVASPPDCSSDGATACVAVAGFPAIDTNLLNVEDIRNSVVLGGVTGDYPSASHPLAGHVPGSTDLVNFLTQLSSDDSFQFFTRTGARLSGSGSDWLHPSNIRLDTNVLGFVGIIPPAPSNFTIVRETGSQSKISWDSEDSASGYLVLVSENTSVTFTPSNGTVYTIGAAVGADHVAYVGSATSFTHTALDPVIGYHYVIYSFDGNNFYSNSGSTGNDSNALDCSSLGFGVWIKVPGNKAFGTEDFCVMKYEAKEVSGVATSQAAIQPWRGRTQSEFKTDCEALGYADGFRLMSNAEWMTIGTSIMHRAENWSTGNLWDGSINRGNAEQDDALAAHTNDTQACYGITSNGDPADDCGGSWHVNKRTHMLSNGEIIWDFAGNAYHWLEDVFYFSTDTAKPHISGDSTDTWQQGYQLNAGFGLIAHEEIFPTRARYWNWGVDQGLGRIYPGSGTGNKSPLRGGSYIQGNNAGLFTANLQHGQDVAGSNAGFRCVKRQVSP